MHFIKFLAFNFKYLLCAEIPKYVTQDDIEGMIIENRNQIFMQEETFLQSQVNNLYVTIGFIADTVPTKTMMREFIISYVTKYIAYFKLSNFYVSKMHEKFEYDNFLNNYKLDKIINQLISAKFSTKNIKNALYLDKNKRNTLFKTFENWEESIFHLLNEDITYLHIDNCTKITDDITILQNIMFFQDIELVKNITLVFMALNFNDVKSRNYWISVTSTKYYDILSNFGIGTFLRIHLYEKVCEHDAPFTIYHTTKYKLNRFALSRSGPILEKTSIILAKEALKDYVKFTSLCSSISIENNWPTKEYDVKLISSYFKGTCKQSSLITYTFKEISNRLILLTFMEDIGINDLKRNLIQETSIYLCNMLTLYLNAKSEILIASYKYNNYDISNFQNQARVNSFLNYKGDIFDNQNNLFLWINFFLQVHDQRFIDIGEFNYIKYSRMPSVEFFSFYFCYDFFCEENYENFEFYIKSILDIDNFCEKICNFTIIEKKFFSFNMHSLNFYDELETHCTCLFGWYVNYIKEIHEPININTVRKYNKIMVLLKYLESNVIKTIYVYFSLYDVFFEGFYLYHLNNFELKNELSSFIISQREIKILQKTLRSWVIDVIYSLLNNINKKELNSFFCRENIYENNLEIYIISTMKEIGSRNEDILRELKFNIKIRDDPIEFNYNDKGEIEISPEILYLLNAYKNISFYTNYYDIIQTLFFSYLENYKYVYINNIEKNNKISKKTYFQFEKIEKHETFVQKYHDQYSKTKGSGI
ncbi:hypothetical protein COBT_001066 [Conglomerata obtusa]